MDNIRSLDLNLLKALDALLDERNVTRAAEKLALTQPAVSSMLNRLRVKFSDPLFVRASHGMTPTNRALALAKPVKQILADINALMQPVEFDPKQLQLTLNIAANDNDMQAIGLPFVLALKQQAPHVKVAFLSIPRLDIQGMLERGELDLIFLDPVNAPAESHTRVLYQERYVCIMREGHPAASQQALTLDRFCELEHALASYEGGQFFGATDEALAKIGRQRNVVLSVTSFLLLPDLLRKSDLIAVVPAHLVQNIQGIVVLEPPVPVQGYTKVMAWHERNHHDPIQQWLRTLIWETCGE